MTVSAAPVTLLLDTIENDIVPLTRAGVEAGNKIFGAAIIDKLTGKLVIAETNNEIENPLWHGEIHTLKRFYEIPANTRPDASQCWFVSTHEPCPLCLSAITWAGFDNFHYLFSHEDSRDSFAIPHDLQILKEVFGLDPGEYRSKNAYWTAFAIRELARNLPGGESTRAQIRIDRITAIYDQLSEAYQAQKEGNTIPLA